MRVKELVELIVDAKYKYYVLGNSKLSDQAYDALEAELRSLDPDNDVLKMVGYTTGTSMQVGSDAHPAVMIKRDVVTVDQMMEIKRYYKLFPFDK